jgi:hypothetical protein
LAFLSKLPTIVLLAALLLGSQCVFAASPALASNIHVTAKFLSIERAPGCGIVVFGSPATFRVTSGPKELLGTPVRVLVCCADFYPDKFSAGASYELQLARKNVHKIEMPNELPDSSWFYLVDATRSSASHR